jgi:hypothetical protein
MTTRPVVPTLRTSAQQNQPLTADSGRQLRNSG